MRYFSLAILLNNNAFALLNLQEYRLLYSPVCNFSRWELQHVNPQKSITANDASKQTCKSIFFCLSVIIFFV